ncbi:MAG: DJ-1/PfpI family protein [Moraxella sp.]|nr:DJ-1/PfpI family protein [Moraxella sp.]
MNIYCLCFDDYETLDYMGAVEFLYRLPDATLHYVSEHGGPIYSKQGFAIDTKPMPAPTANDVLLVVGGSLVDDKAFISRLGVWVDAAGIVLSVCTGSALIAKTGRLDHHRATTNKKAWQWVISQSTNVNWISHARWVHDGKFYTSSGVSAGMDMTLGFIADMAGIDTAHDIARHCEYLWQNDPSKDDFAPFYFNKKTQH